MTSTLSEFSLVSSMVAIGLGQLKLISALSQSSVNAFQDRVRLVYQSLQYH